jgi:hypothetical protein
MSKNPSLRASISSNLVTPAPGRKASFANLARFFGIGGTFASSKLDEHESEHEEEAEVEEVDEESLMWDAQVRHSHSLNIQK